MGGYDFQGLARTGIQLDRQTWRNQRNIHLENVRSLSEQRRFLYDRKTRLYEEMKALNSRSPERAAIYAEIQRVKAEITAISNDIAFERARADECRSRF